MRSVWMAAACGLALTACSQAEDRFKADEAPAGTEAASSAVAAAARTPSQPVARLAYEYRYALALPLDQGPRVMSRHEATCVAAGPQLCQVLSAEADWRGADPGGRLELRGEPGWINRFKAGLADEAEGAGGRLVEAHTGSEDLTSDEDAATRGESTEQRLLQRLETLQAQRATRAADRLEVERQIAEIRRAMDAEAVRRKALVDRIDSARLTLSYQPAGLVAADHPMRPIMLALDNAVGLFAWTVAALIQLGAVILPIGALAGLAWALARRRRRRPAAA